MNKIKIFLINFTLKSTEYKKTKVKEMNEKKAQRRVEFMYTKEEITFFFFLIFIVAVILEFLFR